MSPPLFLVDAFSATPFAGNPAAVVLLDEEADPQWMQCVAEEMKQAETAFIVPQDEGYGLRWFTPVAEVDLCGHATLASAHVLYEAGGAEGVLRFHTRSGVLSVKRAGDHLWMDFPSTPPVEAPVEALRDALGVDPEWIGRTRYDVFVKLKDEASVRGFVPDLGLIARVSGRGLIITALAEAGRSYDFISRFFAPAVGVDEDAVTGSAHCALAPYWAGVLGKTRLRGYQASARGGVVEVEHQGARVALGGQAVTVSRGHLLV